MGRSMSRIDLKTLEIDLAGRDRPDSCSRSSCATTTMIVLIARSSWRHRCQVRRYRMATSLADRSWAAFTTSMRGRHERCTYAALQRSGSVMRVDGPWLKGVELGVRELNLRRGEILLHMVERQRTWNRQHCRRAAEQPGELDLLRSRLMLLGDLGGSARSFPAEGKERDEDDTFATAIIDHRVVLALHDAVLVLDGRDRHHPTSPFDLFDRHLGDADVRDLAAVLVLLDGGKAFLDWSDGIDAVKVVELDAIGPEAAEALLDLGAQHLRFPLARPANAALGRDHKAACGSGEGLADRLLALTAGIRVGRIDHLDSGGDRLFDECGVVRRVGQSVRAKADAGEVDIPESHGRDSRFDA